MDRLPSELLRLIDGLCDEYEQRRSEGATVSIEDFLDRVPVDGRAEALRELLSVELASQQLIADPEVADYLKRFPDYTEVVRAAAAARGCQPPPVVPEKFGRYVIHRLLGAGSFGCVYQAFDPELARNVAIKVPSDAICRSPQGIETFLAEARHAACLKHASIVTIFDVQTDSGVPYIVQELIHGRHLDVWWREKVGQWAILVDVLRRIVTAVGYAHQHNIYHRDLKPANVLVDALDNPYVADFGLAIHEDTKSQLAGQISGSPAYMSPEQARGETHRIDGTTDIWSLGVVLYELLAGRRPFQGDNLASLLTNIQEARVRPPRQINPNIPTELERISLKCLEKSQSDRYRCCSDLEEDLAYFAGVAQSSSGRNLGLAESPVRPHVTPRGLRSFEERDANFYLDLLPGPRDRFGLPESVSFWKARIERFVPGESFSVGLIYGPSGSGKSSFVKAGLIPRLDPRVHVIYIDASPEDTECRLLKALRDHDNRHSPPPTSLPEAVRSLRERSQGTKTLIIIDQFEQWLYANPTDTTTQLADGLRQCDGAAVQCLLLVRDDFWMSITRFMKLLDIRLLEGENSAPVDTFSLSHAERVLTMFGEAYQTLEPGTPTPSQQEFIERSVASLAENGKIVSVRLATFAEMMKSKPWTMESLQQVGGPQGIGVLFLEESFESSSAPPQQRLHRQAARSLLETLLPDAGFDIKGAMRSRDELMIASGYTKRPGDFEALLEILDKQLHLITPADSDGSPSDTANDRGGGRPAFYQLTHDFLVSSVRQWLVHQKKQTWRGRAEIRIKERSALWSHARTKRYLPPLWEYANLRLLVPPARWSELDRDMMRHAQRTLAIRWGSGLAVMMLLLLSVALWNTRQRRRDQLAEVRAAVQALQDLRGSAVPKAITKLQTLPQALVLPELQRQFKATSGAQQLALAYPMAHFGLDHLPWLVDRVPSLPADEVQNLLAALNVAQEQALALVQRGVLASDTDEDWLRKSRYAIVALHLGEPRYAREMAQPMPDPSQRVIFIEVCSQWHGSLRNLHARGQSEVDPAFRAALAIAIGGIDADAWDATSRSRWIRTLQTWYQTEPDKGIHGAADWALRQLAGEAALDGLVALETTTGEQQWHVVMDGLTMVDLPGGYLYTPSSAGPDRDSSGIPVPPFQISNREISRAQFEQFVASQRNNEEAPLRVEYPAEGPRHSLTPAHPVTDITAAEAMLFCNWLSERRRLTPWYRHTNSNWTENLAANGFRIPSGVEWEYACRAAAASMTYVGVHGHLLDRYAVLSASTPRICGSCRPNPWGLFDMHGNVWDVVYNPNDTARCEARGGTFGMASTEISANSRFELAVNSRLGTGGFRIARSIDIAREKP